MRNDCTSCSVTASGESHAALKNKSTDDRYCARVPADNPATCMSRTNWSLISFGIFVSSTNVVAAPAAAVVYSGLPAPREQTSVENTPKHPPRAPPFPPTTAKPFSPTVPKMK